jgi:CBS domain-containing protein
VVGRVNLLLGVFNLLPGAPLDGGRVVRAVVWRIRGDKTAAQIAADRAGIALGMLVALAGGGELLFARDFGGLWLVLLGWFLVTSARTDVSDVLMHSALDGRTVRDIMVTDVVCGYEWQTVDAFVAEVAQAHRHRVYPVMDIDGRLSGMVSLDQLSRVPAAQRGTRHLGAVAIPTGRSRTVGVDDPLPEALAALTPWTPVVPVLAGGRLAGILTRNDVNHAIEISALARARA